MKRIIICSDGTWNRPGITDRGKKVRSNVELFYNCIEAEDKTATIPQVKYYDPGVGSSTYDTRDKIFGGAAGLGIDKNIKDLYTFIMLSYEPGDELYFFGFSRGAYTVRSLAGLIRNCGILKHEFYPLIDKAYELYRDRNDYSHPNSDLMKSFRRNYCIEDISPIKFIGVWDTVGALGIPFRPHYNLEKYKFHDVKLSSHVQNAFHALAIDEQRKLFSPTLWEVDPSNTDKQKVEQRWFAGVHCNVGGGYFDNGLSDIALDWMHKKAIETGLKVQDLSVLNNSEYTFAPSSTGELRNSRSFPYNLFPGRKRDYNLANKRKNANGALITTNEIFDDSVHERIKDKKMRYKVSI